MTSEGTETPGEGRRRMEAGPGSDGLATVGELRAALAGLPGITPVVVNAEDVSDPEEPAIEQVITSAGFGLIDWGDGQGLVPDGVLALNCRVNYTGLREQAPGAVPWCRRPSGKDADTPARDDAFPAPAPAAPAAGMDVIDSWTQDVNGVRYRVRVVPDLDASPSDYEDYTPRQVKAWEEGAWQFAGVLVSPDIPGLDERWLAASQWRIAYGDMPLTTENDEPTGQAGDPAACIRDEVVPELASELWAQPGATARLTELRYAISATLDGLSRCGTAARTRCEAVPPDDDSGPAQSAAGTTTPEGN
jgi:hypothetical protein